MPVVKLEFELDSLAHPELYRLVQAIEAPGLRGERLRQLALAGLILERLRLAPAGSGTDEAIPGPDPAPGAVADRGALPPPGPRLVLVSDVPVPPADLHNVPVLHEELPPDRWRAASASGPALAWAADPIGAQPWGDGGEGQDGTEHTGRAAGNAADVSDVAGAAAPAEQRAAPPPLAPSLAEPSGPVPGPEADPGAGHAAGMTDPIGSTGPADPAVQKPGNRSRLLRMKSRGLFTNE